MKSATHTSQNDSHLDDQQAQQVKAAITVYYDGLCHLCSREINHYRKMKGAERIQFSDITAPGFNAEALGLNPQAVHENLHAQDDKGNIFIGVDAFIAIWKQLDSLNFLAALASKGYVKPVLMGAYKAFTKVRPFLPRKDCADSPYCEIKR